MISKGINLQADDSNGSGIEIKGEGSIEASGYIGNGSYDEYGRYLLAPYKVEAVTTTGDAVTMSKVLGGGINGTDDVTGKNINTNNGDIFGTGAVVLSGLSKTVTGSSNSSSTATIFGIDEVDMTIGGSGNQIEGTALGLVSMTAENTNGDTTVSSEVSGGISGGANLN